MKLIRCKSCDDVVRLIHTKWRKCECGRSGGQYNDDFISATVGGDCEVIGIRNDWINAGKIKRKYPELNTIIQGEYLGDVQIHRIISSNGPKLKISIEQLDKKFNEITFNDKRKYTINVKGDKSPKTIKIPINKLGPSFNNKKTKNESIDLLKKRIIESLNKNPK